MNWDAISAVAETIGVIAADASLAHVARQIDQNTAMMRAESRNVILHGAQQELFTIVENPAIWREFSDGELDDDNIRLLMWHIASLRAREHEWFQLKKRRAGRSLMAKLCAGHTGRSCNRTHACPLGCHEITVR